MNTNFNINQSGSQSAGYPATPITNDIPSERPTRPNPNTSASAMQFSSGMPQSGIVRPTTMGGASHSYSRSSPAIDQKYTPFSNTAEPPKYPPGSKYYIPQTPTGGPSHSPLALEDIRPSQGLQLGDDLMSPNPALEATNLIQAKNAYLAPWAIYAYDWCKWPVGSSGAGKMAICSYLEDAHNFIQVLDAQAEPQEVYSPGSPAFGLEYIRLAEATCAYPVTRILWEPSSTQKSTTDLLATSGDHLRLWSLPPSASTPVSNTISRSSSVNKKQGPVQKLTPLALLSNSKTPEHTAPLTSLDWNQVSPKLIITSSIDTTCTIWDIPTLTAKTQLIAHDKEVFDVRFCAGSVETFVSCGADGSVRMFDLRSLEHSTIIYEPSERTEQSTTPGNVSPGGQQTLTYASPLLRVAASPFDSHMLATFAQDSRIIRILDHRQPGQALLELHGHAAAVNSIEWSTSRRGLLASGGDDCLALTWDLMNSNSGASPSSGAVGADGNPLPLQPEAAGASVKGPAASWRCDFEIANLSWAPGSTLTAAGEWLGAVGGRAVWGVKL